MLTRTVLTTAALLLTSCTPIWYFRASEPSSVGTAAFCGINTSLENARPARVLVVHGMGIHDRTFAFDIETALASRLRMTGGSCAIKPLQIKNPADPDGDYGTIDVCTFTRDDRALTFYVWTWSSLTEPFKMQHLKYDFEHPDRLRLPANRLLKKGTIDLAFSDAVLYAGKFKEKMRYGAEQALCVALTNPSSEDMPCSMNTSGGEMSADLYIVTHSLGSMMVFDAIRQEPSIASAVGRHLKLFAMLANQWPLLELSNVQRSLPKAEPAEQLPGATISALEALLVTRPIEGSLPIVAFSDPNDLLSFRIPDSWSSMLSPDIAAKTTFINVVSTTVHGSVLWLAVHPGSAHTSYWQDGTVLKKLTHGYHCRDATSSRQSD